MSEIKSKKVPSLSPFIRRVECSLQCDFDKYYVDGNFKEVYRKAGIDASGEEFGVIEIKACPSKRDIAEFINSQADTVGVDAYMRALAIQGDSIDNYNTVVNEDKVVDYSKMPDTLADVMTAGDKAKAAFDKLDPALKDGHTTIEGFLGSLTQEKIEAYIKGKVDAAFPKSEVKEGE